MSRVRISRPLLAVCLFLVLCVASAEEKDAQFSRLRATWPGMQLKGHDNSPGSFQFTETYETVRLRHLRALHMQEVQRGQAKQSVPTMSYQDLPKREHLTMYCGQETLDPSPKWADSSGKNNHMEVFQGLKGKVTEVTNWGTKFKAMRMDPNTSYRSKSGLSEAHTVIIVDRYYAGVRGRTLQDTQSNWFIGKHANTNAFYPQTWVFNRVAPSNNEFSMVTGMSHHWWNGYSYSRSWLNGQYVAASYWSRKPSGVLGFGKHMAFNEPSQADIAAIAVWDIELNEEDRKAAEGFLNQVFSIWADPFVEPKEMPVEESRGFPGYVGPMGPQGIPGLPGDKGIKGNNGVPGAQGVTGPQGSAGSIGDKGPAGDDGAIGPQGPPGAIGPEGVVGMKGEPGDDGAKGEEGLKGNPGHPGEKGALGDSGARGARGKEGEVGASGLRGPWGEQGDVGLNGLDGDQGRKGDPGRPGINGEYPEGEQILQRLRPRVEHIHNEHKILKKILQRLNTRDRWAGIIHEPPQELLDNALRRHTPTHDWRTPKEIVEEADVAGTSELGKAHGDFEGMLEGKDAGPKQPIPGKLDAGSAGSGSGAGAPGMAPEVQVPIKVERLYPQGLDNALADYYQMLKDTRDAKKQEEKKEPFDIVGNGGCPEGQEPAQGPGGCPPGMEPNPDAPAGDGDGAAAAEEDAEGGVESTEESKEEGNNDAIEEAAAGL